MRPMGRWVAWPYAEVVTGTNTGRDETRGVEKDKWALVVSMEAVVI